MSECVCVYASKLNVISANLCLFVVCVCVCVCACVCLV